MQFLLKVLDSNFCLICRSMEQSQVEKIKAMPFEVLSEKDRTVPIQDHLFKLIIIGDTGVGKSCLMKRVIDNEF